MIVPAPRWYYRANRFRSASHQERVHGPIVALAARTLETVDEGPDVRANLARRF